MAAALRSHHAYSLICGVSLISSVLAQNVDWFILNRFNADLQLGGRAYIQSSGLSQLTNSCSFQTGYVFSRFSLNIHSTHLSSYLFL